MRDFAAIDFETANWYPESVCSVGIVIVREGLVKDKFYSLIRPEPNFYSRRNTEVHGLTRRDTDSALIFPEVWGQAVYAIGDLPLVAHNAPFDRGCLMAAFKAYGMNYPFYDFLCTLSASRRTFGRALPNHKLHTVSAHCGFDLLNHHHALADAEACAVIAMQIL